MIDPLTAFALAGNIVQFIEVGYKATMILRQIWDASATDENLEIEAVTEDMRDISSKLSAAGSDPFLSEDEKRLQTLARKCEDVARDIQDMLQKLVLTSVGVHRRIEAVQNTLKLMYRADKIESMQKRLGDLSQQMTTRMIFALGKQKSEVFQKLDGITEASRKLSEGTSEQLRDAHTQVRTLFERQREFQKEQTETTKLSLETIRANQRDMRLIFDKLETLAQRTAITETSTEILRSLQFPRMHDRHSLIPDTHSKTFSWIFEAETSPFKKWLEGESGAFWISGKAGSGKSTLMKYLNHAPQAKIMLERWAGGRDLVMASFYFWITGTEMQKTQEGLLQSILCEILRKEPGLIPVVVPTRWRQDQLYHHHPPPWKLAELYEALDAVIREKPKASFCFFIDGLDEFVGDAGQQGEFADRIFRLSESPTVKVCVASRPWIPFMNVFGQRKQRMLTLEHLTRKDMDVYVRDLLQEDSRFAALLKRDPNAIDLVHEIRDKAQGVFLWVALVVRSLLSGLTLNDDLEGLRQRLANLPPDLKQFFRRMLDTIDDDYQLYACRILYLARCATPLPLRTFWWVQVEAKEAMYAIRAPVKQVDGNKENMEKAKTTLNKWTKDLLTVYHSSEGTSNTSDIANFKIDFLHRTVGEFLAEPEIHEILDKKSGQAFDPNLSVCRLLLAEAKSFRSRGRNEDLEEFQEIARRSMHHAKQYEIQHQCGLVDILQELDDVISSRLGFPSSTHWTASFGVSHPNKVASHRAHVSNASSNFFAYAVANNLVEFVRGTLDSSASALRKKGRPLLDFAIYPTFPRHNQSQSPAEADYSVNMVELLFTQGALPNQDAGVLGIMTAWQMLMLDLHASSEGIQSFDRFGAWEVAKLFLRHGADREVEVPVARVVQDISVKRNFDVDETRDYERTSTRRANVTECLVRVEQQARVDEFLARLPVVPARSWTDWRPWTGWVT